MKTAIITGLSGQDGSLLAEQRIAKGYKVFGMIRRTSRGLDLGCAHYIGPNSRLEVVEGDLLDLPSLQHLCKLAKPDLFFHTAAQSHVWTSFNQPSFTMQANAIGTLNCLEAIRYSGFHTRFLNCATSEMFGGVSNTPANEETMFYPRSPYGVSKLASFWMTKNYRESYKMFACNSICFNHEEPGRRGPNFVTRKISIATAKIKLGLQDKLYIGNLDAKRDWGRARDFTQGMITMLEAAKADDYVLATGETHSVREFCDLAFSHVGLDYKKYVEVDPQFYRPAEVNVLIGDYSKINKELGWAPTTKFEKLVQLMVDDDLNNLRGW
jgi:GDPmannose 4,6-dehydratase